MPIFIAQSGSFNALQITGSNLTVISSSIFFNNLATSSTAPNVLLLDNTGQVYYTASNALSAAPQTFNTSSFITTGSINTTQSITGSLTLSGSNITITGSVNVSGSLNATASWAVSASNAISSSYATTASYALNGGSGNTKASASLSTIFVGSPLSASISFASNFSNTNYAVTVTGEDARIWTVTNKTTSSFIINSNSSVALSGPVYWIATSYQ